MGALKKKDRKSGKRKPCTNLVHKKCSLLTNSVVGSYIGEGEEWVVQRDVLKPLNRWSIDSNYIAKF